MPTRDVVITGVALVTPAGVTVKDTWQSAMEKRSGIGTLIQPEASAEPFLVAAVNGFEPDRRIRNSKASKFFLREDFLGTHACLAAVDDAGVLSADYDLQEGGLFVASGKDEIHAQLITEGMQACMENGQVSLRLLGLKGLQQFHPFSLLETMPNTSLFAMSSILGISGPGLCLVGGGDAGSLAIGEAVRATSSGECTFAVAGAQESRIDPFMLLALRAEGVLAPSSDAPSNAMRPFDRGRSGFALGEGAGFVVLEKLESARLRGAQLQAMVLGYGASTDGSNGSSGMSSAIGRALNDAGAAASDIDAIFAWADCTGIGDIREAEGIRQVFGVRASSMPVCCLKPVTGNMLGASAVAELIFAVTALQLGLLPPTRNHTSPDPACGLKNMPTIPTNKELQTVLCLARGLHGQNVALLLGRAAP